MTNLIRVSAEGMFPEEDVKKYVKRKLDLTEDQVNSESFDLISSIQTIIKNLIIEDISMDTKLSIEEDLKRQREEAFRQLNERVSQAVNVLAESKLPE